MIISGIGWISGSSCGSLRLRRQEAFQEPSVLYTALEQEGVFSTPLKKVRWFCDLSQRFCLASGLALRDAGKPSLNSSQVGMLSLSRDGALDANLKYFKEYIQSGRKSAHGNLFINTLPTSPLAQVAMNLGFKGPIFHLSTAEPAMGGLLERAESLARRTEGLNLLCCVGGEKGVISFLMRPETAASEGWPVRNLKLIIGSLWELDEVFEALKIQTGAVHEA